MEASRLIDEMIVKLADWRGATLAQIRKTVREADPEIVEELKWKGTPVWSHNGIVCLAKAFKDKVKMTFYDGASLADPDKLFNSELEGRQWRAIDYYKDDKVKERELTNLVRGAVAHNLAKAKAGAKGKKEGVTARRVSPPKQ
jgi:hypothetical protein